MCATSVSIAEINTRLDEPANSFYSASSSPSSISEVELGQRSQYSEECVQNEPKANKVCEESGSEDATTPAGDTSLPTVDDRTSCCTAALSYINADVSSALSTSSTPRKRRWSQVVDENDECLAPAKRAQVGDDQDVRRPASPDSQEDQLRACSESADGSSLDQSAVPADDYDDDVCYSPAVDLDCSEARLSRRTLYIEYWSRTDECKERKWDHLDEIAEKYGSAEEHIFATTLNGRTACLEPNMFPYNTPDGIEHWTLWHVQDLTHEQVKQYVENWIDVNAPHVLRWNYDDNPERSIDIFHVHVYFQVGDADSVLQGRNFEDLVHECD